MQNRSIQSLSRCDQWDLMGELALSAGVICNALFTQTYSGFYRWRPQINVLLDCTGCSYYSVFWHHWWPVWMAKVITNGTRIQVLLMNFNFSNSDSCIFSVSFGYHCMWPYCHIAEICTVNNNQGLLKGSSCNIPWFIYIWIHYPYLYLLISLPHQSLSFPSSLSLWALNLTAQYRNRSRLSFNIECVRQCSAQHFLL